jgi:hypothetical protein
MDHEPQIKASNNKDWNTTSWAIIMAKIDHPSLGY